MSSKGRYPVSRREFVRVSAAAAAGASMLSFTNSFTDKVPPPLKRKFGKLNFDVTTIGLGGQGSIMWTPDDVDPAAIIVKAFDLGINYFDTSNIYGPSQMNFHEAFTRINLIPGKENYNKELRESIWLTSKTRMRWGKPGWEKLPRVSNGSQGEEVQCAVDDIKRSLSQMFGDNQGNYPKGAYLDMVLIHALRSPEEVDVLYQGLETPLEKDGNFGALVALRDYRDGTNLTGMNPKKEKLIKHIGFSGHNNPETMMDMILRDEYGILDGLLVSINSNDKLYFNMQHNVIPMAEAKGMGIIGMKVFADAAMYHKEPKWSKTPVDVYRKVGSPRLPSRPLIEYVLTSPGIHTLIIGIGQIDEDPLKCQLVQNYYDSQIEPDALNEMERKKIEYMTSGVKDGRTNWFQLDRVGLSAPRALKKENKNGQLQLTWETAFADQYPICHYEVMANGKTVGKVEHKPQLFKSKPFSFDSAELDGNEKIEVITVDKGGNRKAGLVV